MTRQMKDIIRELRKEKGLTQYEFAKRIGFTRSAVGNYESGVRVPNDEAKQMICDFFNVDMDYLYGKTDVKVPCHYTTDMFSFLTDEELEKVISYARFIYESRDK